jgi:hypothetical protein
MFISNASELFTQSSSRQRQFARSRDLFDAV